MIARIMSSEKGLLCLRLLINYESILWSIIIKLYIGVNCSSLFFFGNKNICCNMIITMCQLTNLIYILKTLYLYVLFRSKFLMYHTAYNKLGKIILSSYIAPRMNISVHYTIQKNLQKFEIYSLVLNHELPASG